MDRRMNGTQDDRQGLVHKDEDDADLWQTGGVRDVSAPADEKNTHINTGSHTWKRSLSKIKYLKYFS